MHEPNRETQIGLKNRRSEKHNFEHWSFSSKNRGIGLAFLYVVEHGGQLFTIRWENNSFDDIIAVL
jgi:hypothetical protein